MNGKTKGPKQMQELKVLAKKLYEQERYRESQHYYEMILSGDPHNAQVTCYLAQTLIQANEFLKAKEVALHAIKMDNRLDKAYYVAAKVFERLEDYDVCVKLLKTGISMCSNTGKLSEYLNQVENMKNSKRSPSRSRSTDGGRVKQISGSESSLLQHGFLLPRKNSEKSQPDDCPDLVSDSDSDSGSGTTVSQKQSATSKPVLKSDKNPVAKKTSSEEIAKQTTAAHNCDADLPQNAKNDEFLKTIIAVAKEKKLTHEDLEKSRMQKFKLLCKEGSEAYLAETHRKAIEKYQSAIDLLDDLPLYLFQIGEIDHIVLKYMLCVLWIESANYQNIVNAVNILKAIEKDHTRIFPSVYYLLALAYHKLNRNRAALEPIDKGLSFLEKNIQFQSQPFPQIYEIIPETKKDQLFKRLNDLSAVCRAYHQSDVICRYNRCLTVSSHIIPSVNICYSDPDFTGYISVYCEERCKINFHHSCWRVWKEEMANGRKLSDGDLLGHECFTENCETLKKERSRIIQIDIIGTDGRVKSSKKDNEKSEKKQVTLKREKSEKKEMKPELACALPPKEKPTPVKKEKKPEVEPAKQTHAQSQAEAEDDPDVPVDMLPASMLQRLATLRAVDFGHKNEGVLDPEISHYGISMSCGEPIEFGVVTNDPEINASIEFILSMYYQFLKSEGPQFRSELLKKWNEEKGDIDPSLYITKTYKNICNLLLESYHFCQVGNYIATSEHVHKAHKLMLNQALDNKAEFCDLLNDILAWSNKPHANADSVVDDFKSHPPDVPKSDVNKCSEVSSDLDHKSPVENVNAVFSHENTSSPVNVNQHKPLKSKLNKLICMDLDDNIDNNLELAVEVKDEASFFTGVIEKNKNFMESIRHKLQNDLLHETSDSVSCNEYVNEIVAKLKEDENLPEAALVNAPLGTAFTKKIQKKKDALSQTIVVEAKQSGSQTDNQEADHESLLNSYRTQLEEMTRNHSNVELMLVKSYEANAKLTEQLDKLRLKYKKVVEEKDSAIEKRNETIKKLKATVENSKIDDKLKTLQKKVNDAENKEKELESLRRRLKQCEEESETKTEEITCAEEFILVLMKELVDALQKNFTQRSMEKLQIINQTLPFSSEETKPTTEQLMLVKRKWEDAENETNSKITEFHTQIIDVNEKITKGERLKNLSCPPIPSLYDDPFDPVVPLFGQLLEDNSKISDLVYRHIPQALAVPVIRNCFIKRQVQRTPTPPNQIFFGHYQMPMNVYSPHVIQRPVHPVPLMSVVPGAPVGASFQNVPRAPGIANVTINPLSGGNLMYNRAFPSSSPVKQPQNVPGKPPSNPVVQPEVFRASSRSQSVSSTKSDASTASVCSSVSAAPRRTRASRKKSAGETPENCESGKKSHTMSESEDPFKITDRIQNEFIGSNETEVASSTSSSNAATNLKGGGFFFKLPELPKTKPAEKNGVKSSLKPTNSILQPVSSMTSLTAPNKNSPSRSAVIQKLMNSLGKAFPKTSDAELLRCLRLIRENNNGSIVGLDLTTITEKVREQIKARAKNAEPSLFEKFSGSAWTNVKEIHFDWNKNEEEDYTCSICLEGITPENRYTLSCKHEFHSKCIRPWLLRESVCPECRRRCLLPDEYPPL